MRELLKSMVGCSWALSLFGARRMGDLLAGGDDGAASVASLAAVGRAAAERLSAPFADFYAMGDRLQRRMVDALFAVADSGIAEAGPTTRAPASLEVPPARVSVAPPVRVTAADSGRLDVSTFLVLGEGLAAGMGDFALSADTQRGSFPAQMCVQMAAPFIQPLVQPAGLAQPPGYPQLPVIVPAPLQTSVLEDCPPAPASNLSVPGLTLHDALRLRPVAPMVDRRSAKQTAVNLFWGALPLARGDAGALPTQLEYALRRNPTFVIVALGYTEVLEAVARQDDTLVPEAADFGADFQRLVRELRRCGSEVLALNVPDPMDTACACSVDAAADVLKVPPGFLREAYGFGADDFVTVAGLNEIGFQLFARAIAPLPAGTPLGAGIRRGVTARVGRLNAAIGSVARDEGALLYDLHGLFGRVAREGVQAGSRRLGARYLEGFYSLNGMYPGAAGQAVIANELLQLLNDAYRARFEPIDLNAVVRADPVANYRAAAGPSWDPEQLRASVAARVSGGTRAEAAPERASNTARRTSAPDDTPLVHAEPASAPRLQLPPGLEQVVPLSKAASYFGDGIGAQHCRDDPSAKWGTGNLLFGGLAIVDSHLAGQLHIRFSPPVDDRTRFELSFGDGLLGDDALLVAPQYFKMAFQQSRVDDVPGRISSGTLNLSTGEVTDLAVYARYASTALMALVGVNPTFPKQPLSFPGPYGSAWARFEPRPDGTLDFTFYGSAFVPLGPGIVWPLNFVGPSGQFATVPASGTVMHPHLHLSTKDPVAPGPEEDPPDIPFNSIRELTLYTHNSSFGDAFTLDSADLGGPAKGRSHVLGRVQLQFGARSGDSVPVAVSHLDAGGLLNVMPPSPITQVFPGRLYNGPRGFNEFLRFPLRTYSLDDLAILDDPFDIAMGMVDLRTGRLINELLHRAFINQDLIFALLRVEPRTPKDSFYFRGPARLQKGPGGRLVFRHQAAVRVPYPEGFFFPKPNLTTGIVIGSHSVLDPFLWVRAFDDDVEARAVKEGRGDEVLSSAGERFSYRYRVSNDPKRPAAIFEYENHSQHGSFRLHRLSWLGFGNSLGSSARAGDYDTVTFSGFGVWSKDGLTSLQQAAVQISASRTTPYVGIQIGGGDVSDVNTKPADERDAFP